MSATDEFLRNNEAYVTKFDSGGLPTPPKKQVAVVTCMDSRMDIFAILGLNNGEAHIIRNAGGVVTDDVIRSLAISQRKLGTREIVVINHTQCGMLTFTDDEFRENLRAETGMKPPWSPESFSDLDAEVRNSLNRIRNSPFVPYRDAARGFVYDVETGKLREVPSSA
jgi:carbonic anhydrase